MISASEKTQLLKMLSEYTFFSAHLDWIEQKYSEAHRRYHTLEHVKCMLDLRDRAFQSQTQTVVPMNLGDSNLVKAIVYHDIVYADVPQAVGVNEFHSATVAAAQGCDLEVAQAIVGTGMYMLDQRFLSPLAQELCDLDLANLALDYDQYVYWSTLALEEALQIYFGGRAPGAVLYAGQINFCEMMLNREQIYYRHTDWEDLARANLEQRIDELQEKPSDEHT